MMLKCTYNILKDLPRMHSKFDFKIQKQVIVTLRIVFNCLIFTELEMFKTLMEDRLIK